MGDKGQGGVKNIKKWMTSFMDLDSPLPRFSLLDIPQKSDITPKIDTFEPRVISKE